MRINIQKRSIASIYKLRTVSDSKVLFERMHDITCNMKKAHTILYSDLIGLCRIFSPLVLEPNKSLNTSFLNNGALLNRYDSWPARLFACEPVSLHILHWSAKSKKPQTEIDLTLIKYFIHLTLRKGLWLSDGDSTQWHGMGKEPATSVKRAEFTLFRCGCRSDALEKGQMSDIVLLT